MQICKYQALPLATGETERKLARAAPVPWPMTVTLSGSPPKAGRFSRNQCNPATKSIRPKLPCADPLAPVFKKPVKIYNIYKYLLLGLTHTLTVCLE